MNQTQQVLIEAFGERTSMRRPDLLARASETQSNQVLERAYQALSRRGVLMTDDFGIVTLNRVLAARFETEQLQAPLYDDYDED